MQRPETRLRLSARLGLSLAVLNCGDVRAEDWQQRRCTLLERDLVRLAGDCLFLEGPGLDEVSPGDRRVRLQLNHTPSGGPEPQINGRFTPDGGANPARSITDGWSLLIALARTSPSRPARLPPIDDPRGLWVSH